jgi:hypothetical protein
MVYYKNALKLPRESGFLGMYPETNTLPKQPYPAVPIGTSSAAGLVDYLIMA